MVKCTDCSKELSTKNVRVKRCRACYYKFIGSAADKPWLNKEWLMHQYYTKKLSYAAIARLINVSPSVIDYAFKDKFKLKPRERNLKGSKNISWKGGKTMINGYIHLHHPEPHPRKSTGAYVPEHVLVVEKSLGRKLEKDEHVHHRNGIKTDNRIENLQVLSSSDHRRLEHLCELFTKQLVFGDIAPHLRDELYPLFSTFVKERLNISV